MTLLLSVIIAGTALAGGRHLLGGIFGKVEQDVMDNAQTCLLYTSKKFCEDRGCEFALSEVWAKGGEGGIALAEKVMETLENKPTQYHVLYPDEMSLKDKINTIAKEIYGADGASFAPAAAKALKRIEDMGFGNLPVCMAKTQYSLSDDQTKLGRPAGFTINVRDAYVSAGAGFVVALTGSIMTMPGLPKKPAADSIDVDENGKITGLF